MSHLPKSIELASMSITGVNDELESLCSAAVEMGWRPRRVILDRNTWSHLRHTPEIEKTLLAAPPVKLAPGEAHPVAEWHFLPVYIDSPVQDDELGCVRIRIQVDADAIIGPERSRTFDHLLLKLRPEQPWYE